MVALTNLAIYLVLTGIVFFNGGNENENYCQKNMMVANITVM